MGKVVLKVCVRDEESIQKEKFVRDYLAPLLKAVNPHIVEVEYHKFLLARRGLRRLAGVGGEAGSEVLQFISSMLSFLIGFLCLACEQLIGLVPEVVIAHIHIDSAVIDVAYVRAHLVEEVTVMRYDNESILKVH